MNTPMRARVIDRVSAPRLASFWFGIQAVWGAFLGISLQARSAELSGSNAIGVYGVLAVSGAVVAAIVQLVAGVWSDALVRRGRNRAGFYVAGSVVAAVAIVWFYQAPDVLQLIAAVIALQAGMNAAIGAYQAAVPDAVEPARYGAASGWMAGLQNVGNAAGAALAALAADTRIVAATLAATLLATCAATVAHVRRIPIRIVAGPAIVFSRPFVDLFVSRALIYTGFYTMLGYLYFYVSSLPRSSDLPVKTQSGILILLFTLSGALGAALAAGPTDRRDKRAVASLGGLIFVAGLALFIAAPSAAPAAAAALGAGVGWGIFLVADWALACRVLPAGALATSMAVWNLAVVGAQAAAPLLAGLLLLRSGALYRQNGPRVAFSLAIAEILVGILWISRLPKRISVE